MRLVIAEDDQRANGNLTDFLSRQGHRVASTVKSLDYLEEVRRRDGDFDVLLCGFSEGTTDDIIFLKAVKGQYPQATTLVMISDPNSFAAVQALKSGVHAFIQRPVRHAELTTLLRQIEEHRSRRNVLQVTTSFAAPKVMRRRPRVEEGDGLRRSVRLSDGVWECCGQRELRPVGLGMLRSEVRSAL